MKGDKRRHEQSLPRPCLHREDRLSCVRNTVARGRSDRNACGPWRAARTGDPIKDSVKGVPRNWRIPMRKKRWISLVVVGLVVAATAQPVRAGLADRVPVRMPACQGRRAASWGVQAGPCLSSAGEGLRAGSRLPSTEGMRTGKGLRDRSYPPLFGARRPSHRSSGVRDVTQAPRPTPLRVALAPAPAETAAPPTTVPTLAPAPAGPTVRLPEPPVPNK